MRTLAINLCVALLGTPGCVAPVGRGSGRDGQFSIRINQQWRVCFNWRSGDAYDVESVHGNRAVTGDTALRLARYFGVSDRFWLNLQASYDLDVEREKLGDRLEAEVLPRAVR